MQKLKSLLALLESNCNTDLRFFFFFFFFFGMTVFCFVLFVCSLWPALPHNLKRKISLFFFQHIKMEGFGKELESPVAAIPT